MKRFVLALAAFAVSFAASALDHSHKAWDDLLKKHVKYVQDGNASRVDYAGFARDRAQLKSVLDEYQKVPKTEFDTWTKPQQQAFLVNAYNALTVEKILTRYPGLKSIRDFGSVFGNPWKDKFFTLFGEPSSLDAIEHETLRKEGVYDDPRVHVAVVCASIGCPMLRRDAFTAANLEVQLDDGMKRFLADRTRNRYNAQARKVEVSKIFDWYGKDFDKGHKGFTSVKATLAKYADQLADKPEDRAAVRDQKADVAFLEYDWALNDAK
jgi:uncharacterized protein DUF547